MPRIHIDSNGVGTRPGMISGGNVQVNNAAFEAQMASSRANQKALQGLNQQLETLSAAVMKKEEEDDNLRRLNAENEYNRRIGDLKGEIEEQRRLGNAQDVTQYFMEQEEAIRKEVYTNSGIKYKKTEQSFRLNAERLAIADTDRVQSFENDQTEKYRVVTLDNNIKNSIKTGIQTGKMEDIASSSASIRGNVQAIYGKYGDEVVEAKTREALTELTTAAAYNKSSLGDTDGAIEVINFMRPFVDDQKVAKLVADLNETKRTEERLTSVNKAVAENPGRLLSQEEYWAKYGGDTVEYAVTNGEDLSKQFDSGEGTVWKKQGSDVVVSNLQGQAKSQAVIASQIAKKLGLDFVITSGTNGTSHATGEKSHYNGWKIDIESYKWGPEQKRAYIDELNRSGMVAVLEDEGGESEHIDVVLSGGVTQQNRAKTPAERLKEYETYRATFYQEANYKKQKKQETVDTYSDSILNRMVALGENPTVDQVQSTIRTVQQEIIQIANGDSELYAALTGKTELLLRRYEKIGQLPKATPQQKWAFESEAALGNLGVYKSEAHLLTVLNSAGIDFGDSYGKIIDSWRKGTQGQVAETAKAAAMAVGIPEKDLNTPTGKNLLGQGIMYLKNAERNNGKDFTQDERATLLQDYFKKNSVELPGTGNFGFWKDSLKYSKAELNQIGIDDVKPMEYDGMGNRTDGLLSIRYTNGQYGTMSVREFQERMKAAQGEETSLMQQEKKEGEPIIFY